MGTYYRCDFCGNEIKNRNDLRVITLPHMNHYLSGFTDEDENYQKEVCAGCTGAILRYIKGLGNKVASN